MAKNTHDDKAPTNQSLLQKTGKAQAAFVPKLYTMVENMRQPTPKDPNPERPLISWSKTGDVFCVFDPIEFSRVVLPLHFKHNNWQSFVRQLNMYGFHKVNDLLSGSHCHQDAAQAWEFRHPHFKRDRPDLLQMIKRKSTKHHGSSKITTAQVMVQASSLTGETRFHQHIPHDDASGGTSPPCHGDPPHDVQGPALPSVDRPPHSNPPPPSPLYLTNINTLSHLPARPPVLHPLLTHQIRYPLTWHRKVKSSSLSSKPENIKGSSSTSTTNTRSSCSMPPSPPSSQPFAHNLHSITSQPAQPISHSVQEDIFISRSYVDAWRSKPESHRSDSALSRVEDELRRLNSTLSHRDVTGNQMFSVLGLLVELVTLLVHNHEDKNPPNQHQALSSYVQAVKGAMAKLENSSHGYHEPERKFSVAPSTASMSPVSTDPMDQLVFQSNQTPKNPGDSNNLKRNDQADSSSHVGRPRYSDRLSSSQSLPPLRTIVENWAPPILNRTRSSGPLPASIDRLMNDISHKNSPIQMSPASSSNETDEHAHDNHGELIQDGDGNNADHLVPEDDDADSDESHDNHQNYREEDDNQHQLDGGSDHEDRDNDYIGYEETLGQSANGQKSAGYHLSDTSERPTTSFSAESGTEVNRCNKIDRTKFIRPVKRSGSELRSILWPSANESAEQLPAHDPLVIDTRQKRTRIV